MADIPSGLLWRTTDEAGFCSYWGVFDMAVDSYHVVERLQRVEERMKPTPDTFAEIDLPEDVKEEFLNYWDEPEYSGGSDRTDGACGRCGATVAWSRFELHVRHHKNLSFAMFLQSQWAIEHMKAHEALGEAFPEIIEFLQAALGDTRET